MLFPVFVSDADLSYELTVSTGAYAKDHVFIFFGTIKFKDNGSDG